MSRGRPPLGPDLVDTLPGPDEAKRRFKRILETLSGEKTILEACAELGISEAAFHELRKQALGYAVERLSPRPAGRPRKYAEPEAQRIQDLEAQVVDLKKDLQAARIREELAIAMPHLLINKKAARGGREKKSPGRPGTDTGRPTGRPTGPDAAGGAGECPGGNAAGPSGTVGGS